LIVAYVPASPKWTRAGPLSNAIVLAAAPHLVFKQLGPRHGTEVQFTKNSAVDIVAGEQFGEGR